MSSIKDIKSHMKGYQFLDLAAGDVHSMIQHYKDLKPGVEDYTRMHGHKNDHKKQLFCLRGTIPVVYRGSSYNIPIVVWLQKTHPQDSPIVYVTPTPGMRINSSRYVDGSGRVYLPYLTEWTLGKNDLLTLIQILSATFADYIPVYIPVNEFTNQQGSVSPGTYPSPVRPPSQFPSSPGQLAISPSSSYYNAQTDQNLEQRRNSAGNDPQRDLLALEQKRHREEIDVLQHQIGALLEQKIANEKWSTGSPSMEDLRKDWEEEKVVLTSQVKAYSRQCEELKKSLFRIQEESKSLQEQVNHKSRIQFEVDDLKTQLQSEMDSKAHLMTSLRREQQRALDLEEKLAVYIKEYSKLQESNRAMQDELQTLNDQLSKLMAILPPEYLRILHVPHHQHRPSVDTRREYKEPFIPNQHFMSPNIDRSPKVSSPKLLSGSNDPPQMTISQLQQFAKQAQQQREQVILDLQQEQQESLTLLEEERRKENLLAEKALQELEKAERERIKKQGNRKVSLISKATPTNYYSPTFAESGAPAKDNAINQTIEGTSEVIDNTNTSDNMPEHPLLENIHQNIQYYADQVLDITKHSTTTTEEVEDSNHVYCGNLTKEIRQEYHEMMRRPTTKEVQEDKDSSLPYDSNLVCHKCGKRYRIGEIQKFKRHINEFCPKKQ